MRDDRLLEFKQELIAIVGIGVAPLWLSNLIMDSLQPIADKLAVKASLS